MYSLVCAFIRQWLSKSFILLVVISLATCSTKRSVTYSFTTGCKVNIASASPPSSSERRLSASSASRIFLLGTGGTLSSTKPPSATNSRAIASQERMAFSKAERRLNCWSSKSRISPKKIVPSLRNAAMFPPKTSRIILATNFKANGFPV